MENVKSPRTVEEALRYYGEAIRECDARLGEAIGWLERCVDEGDGTSLKGGTPHDRQWAEYQIPRLAGIRAMLDEFCI